MDELKSGNVTAYGTGLTHGISNEPCHFIINTKDAGAGKSQLFSRFLRFLCKISIDFVELKDYETSSADFH